MTDQLAWLPDLVLFSAFGGRWQEYEDALYEHFRRDFLEAPHATFPERRWALKRMPESKGKVCTFWHLVSEGKDEAERIPDLRRCERICWPRPIVDEYGKSRVRYWRTVRGRAKRVLIAVPDFSYVVVLDDRDTFILLWTAFHVDQSNRRRQLREEWQRYQIEQRRN